MDSKMFHQRARDCLRLADECPDLYAREALMELADASTWRRNSTRMRVRAHAPGDSGGRAKTSPPIGNLLQGEVKT